MPLERFTADWVKRVKPPASGRVDWWDSKETGLGLRVSFTGAKRWMVRYIAANGKRRRVMLGEYPAVTFADANERSAAVLLDATREKDPAQVLADRKASPTIEQLADEYFEQHASQQRAHTQRNIRHALDRDIRPTFGKRKAADIRRKDVLELLDRIVRRGAPSAASHVLQVLRALYNWAILRELVEVNPCHLVEVPAVMQPRSRWLDEAELRAVWAASGGEKPMMRALYRLCLLTGQRGGEVRQMRWQDLDLDGGWWTIPATVAKNKIEHRVPLTAPARALLDEVKALGIEGEWLFTKNGKRPIGALEHLYVRIRERSGVDHTLHDLRRTVSTHLAQLGFTEEEIGKVLNHAKRTVTGRHYIHHTYEKEKREALDAWTERLMTVVG